MTANAVANHLGKKLLLVTVSLLTEAQINKVRGRRGREREKGGGRKEDEEKEWRRRDSKRKRVRKN